MARYNALGRIRDLIFFQWGDGTGAPPHPVTKSTYARITKELNEKRRGPNIRVSVFYGGACGNCLELGSDPYPDKKLLRFFGTDCCNGTGYGTIGTNWVQDILSFRDAHQLYVPEDGTINGISHVLCQLKLMLSPLQVEAWPVETAGGSILLGRCGHQDYALIGLDDRCGRRNLQQDSRHLAQLLGIPSARVIAAVPPPSASGFDTLLYHADLYLTPAGPHKQKDGELILYAAVSGATENYSTREINAELKSVLAAIGSALGKNKVRFEQLPLHIINRTYLLSYNNMIVENYIDERTQRRVRRAFVPDYSEALAVYYMQLREKVLQEPAEYRQLLNETEANLQELADEYNMIILPTENSIRKVVKKHQRKIKTLLKSYGFAQVLLITMPDYDTRLNSAGALHCRSKVVRRDLLP